MYTIYNVLTASKCVAALDGFTGFYRRLEKMQPYSEKLDIFDTVLLRLYVLWTCIAARNDSATILAAGVTFLQSITGVRQPSAEK